MPDAYKQSGVDIEAADRLIDQIKPMAASTRRKEVLGGIGGFGGLFAVPKGYEEPILVSGTDGVGTKLLVAQALERHTTIGIDLVAMCVNDILVVGAEPLFFLDYFATGALNPTAAAEVVSGVAEGCRQAGCTLLGGETAEMPGMYAPGHYDLAGFTVGVAEKAALPDPESIEAGDVLVALPSNGLHSNGFSLVRRVLEGLDWASPFEDRTLGEVVLDPTRIYVKDMLPLFRDGRVKGAAHITGGGLPGNIPRMLPDGVGAVLDPWPLPAIFKLLQSRGELSDADMQQTFNLGIGMVLAVAPENLDTVLQQTDGWQLGELVPGAGVSVR